MRCAERLAVPLGAALLVASSYASAEGLEPVHQARYAMGTMYDVVVYHASATEAELAIAKAFAEIVRLDHVMSNFKESSDLSRLNREGRNGFVTVDPSLYDIIEKSIAFTRLSSGTFDVTIAPLLRVWKQAHADGRNPTEAEIAAASRCVGAEHVELRAPDRVRYLRDCVEIDLGGIGKGYAVDRALAVLQADGIAHALVNAGGSSIGAIGAPPGRDGWPVHLGAPAPGGRTLVLHDESTSTSQQVLEPHALAPGAFGHIIDPGTRAPMRHEMAVTIVSRSGTTAEALSKAIGLLPVEKGRALLARYDDVSAIWMTRQGELHAAYGKSQLIAAEPR